MSSALTTVDQRIDSGCLVSEMVKGGCTVGTADAPAPFRIVDLDHAAAPVGPNAPKCVTICFSPRRTVGVVCGSSRWR